MTRPVGRPKKEKKNYVPHRTREEIGPTQPVHVTVKLRKEVVGTLRNKRVWQIFKNAVRKARVRGIRIIHFTIQRDHIHLLIEPGSNEVLSKGMQSFGISFSKAIQAQLKTKQKIYKYRYHLVVLKSKQQVKNLMNYIARNAKKHRLIADFADTYSSVLLIPGKRPDFSRYFKNFEELHIFYEEIFSITDPPRLYLCHGLK